MDITITSPTHNTFTLQLNYPREFSGLQQLEERKIKQKAPWGNFYINELWFDGACVFQSEIEANKSCQLNMKCEGACWLMNFVLDGELSTAVQTQNDLLNMKAGHYNCLYCTNLNLQTAVQKPTRLFIICLTKRFMKHLLWKSPLILNDTLQADEQSVLVTGIQPITEQLQIIIDEITHAQHPAYIRRIYLEAKILELLSHQLQDSALGAGTSPKAVAENQDIEKLRHVKKFIEENLRNPLSLTELAKRSGLNEFKLKKGFKATYGFTAFGYLTELRMQKAKELLQAGQTVSEVADIVGYKNAHHFTEAFKKRYKQLPSLVKK
ncbi:helix-turn-helix domain-containing protein [Mucilaginibacter lacusdianchii]|uniref:helix-turn-helix domain-containing protein n=1 Tax=Mucilaginibacter lacusdianchii TaxID=2684211 RepID=UPI00131B7340|nr:AraC family transcriptional regulator [Mucilaginibacter sp. JXJ CY 39]